jgi:hypothetical protein
MQLHRYYFREGVLAFRLHLDPAEVASLEAKLARHIVFSERFKPSYVLSGLYEISSERLDIGPSTWLPTGSKPEPLTELLRPHVMPFIEAEIAKIKEARDRELLAEAHSRGWVVIERPSEFLRGVAERAAAGDPGAIESLERLGAEEGLPAASPGH